MTRTPIANAARLLREAAAELKNCHTRGDDDWTGEQEAKAAYDEYMDAATAIEAAAPGQCLHQISEPAAQADALKQAEAGLEVAVGRLAQDGKDRGDFKPSEVLALECVRAALAPQADPAAVPAESREELARRLVAEAAGLEAIKLPPHDPTIAIESILGEYDSDDREEIWESIKAYADIHARRAVLLARADPDHFRDATQMVGEAPAAVRTGALYAATNEMMAHLGRDGEINTRHPAVDAVMAALHGVDGGSPHTQADHAAATVTVERYEIPGGMQRALHDVIAYLRSNGRRDLVRLMQELYDATSSWDCGDCSDVPAALLPARPDADYLLSIACNKRWPMLMRAHVKAAALAIQATGLPAPAAVAGPADDGWLQVGGLLYRLTDERRPCNRDEINVTMADGSRSNEARARRAGELLGLIRDHAASTLESSVAKPGGLVAVPLDLISAACSAIDKKRDAPKLLAELRRYTVGDLSRALEAPSAVTGRTTPRNDDERAAAQFFADNPSAAVLAWPLYLARNKAAALEAPAAPMTAAEACAALAINSALHRIRSGNADGAIEPLEHAKIVLAAAHQATTEEAPATPEWEQFAARALELAEEYGDERGTAASHGEFHCRREPAAVLLDLRQLLAAAPQVPAPAQAEPVSDEPPFLQRLRVEQRELQERYEKLEAFLTTSAFSMLDNDDADLLVKQSIQQHSLLQTLNQRIHSATEKHLRSKNHE